MYTIAPDARGRSRRVGDALPCLCRRQPHGQPLLPLPWRPLHRPFEESTGFAPTAGHPCGIASAGPALPPLHRRVIALICQAQGETTGLDAAAVGGLGSSAGTSSQNRPRRSSPTPRSWCGRLGPPSGHGFDHRGDSGLQGMACQGRLRRILGARPLRWTVQRFVEPPISNGLLGGHHQRGDAIVVDAGEDGLTFRDGTGGTGRSLTTRSC